METEADISVLSSWCPDQGGDVCVSCVHHIIQLINVTAHYRNQALVCFCLCLPPALVSSVNKNESTSEHNILIHLHAGIQINELFLEKSMRTLGWEEQISNFIWKESVEDPRTLLVSG